MASELVEGRAPQIPLSGGKLIKPAALAERLGIEEKTLAQWRSQGKGPPFVRLQRSIRYRPEDIDLYIAENVANGNERDETVSHPTSKENYRPGGKSKAKAEIKSAGKGHLKQRRKKKKGSGREP